MDTPAPAHIVNLARILATQSGRAVSVSDCETVGYLLEALGAHPDFHSRVAAEFCVTSPRLDLLVDRVGTWRRALESEGARTDSLLALGWLLELHCSESHPRPRDCPWPEFGWRRGGWSMEAALVATARLLTDDHAAIAHRELCLDTLDPCAPGMSSAMKRAVLAGLGRVRPEGVPETQAVAQ